VYRWGLPLAGLFGTVALALGIVTLCWLTGWWLWLGTGVAALFFYTAVLCVHHFELSSCPADSNQPSRDRDRGQ
jgi:hypothetical protein